MSSLTKDDQYLKIMPKPLRWSMISYLFDDVFRQFRGFLKKKEFESDYQDFYYQLAFEFLPRKYDKGESIVF